MSTSWTRGAEYSKIGLRTKKHLERIMAAPLGEAEELEAWVEKDMVIIVRKKEQIPIMKLTREIWDSFKGGPG